MIRFPTEPMKANLGTLPSVTDDANWAYEIKWDGYRTLAFIVDGRLKLQSTKGIDVTAKYPELAGLPGALAVPDAVLDGELVVLDDDGKPRFELIQRHERQAMYFVFDLLHLAGHDTTGLPYENRRALLAQSLETGSNWSVPDHRIGDGAALLAATAAGGLEGIMAKRLGSTYQPGKRSPAWRKVKIGSAPRSPSAATPRGPATAPARSVPCWSAHRRSMAGCSSAAGSARVSTPRRSNR